jgi:hypothetical protein
VLKNTEAVLEAVYQALHPHPGPPTSRGREQSAESRQPAGSQTPAGVVTDAKAKMPTGCSPSPLTGEGRDGGVR